MKTRIKIIETADGEKKYLCQKKGFDSEWFIYFFPILGLMLFFRDLFWQPLKENRFSRKEHLVIENAKLEIDIYLENIAREKQIYINKAIKKVTYVKHP